MRPHPVIFQDFVIVPPIGANFEGREILADIEAALKGRFPGWTFRVTCDSEFRDDTFVVMPFVKDDLVGNEQEEEMASQIDAALLARYFEMSNMPEIGHFLYDLYMAPKRLN